MKYILFLGIFSLITLVSCNKNEKKKITPDLLNCCYKTNSYWVYIDSVSNNIDSVYVVNYDHYFHEHYVTDHTSYDVEYYIFTTESSFSLRTTNFKITIDYIDKQYSDTDSHTTIYRDYDNTTAAYPGGGYKFEHLDSAFIYNRYYYRVLKIEIEQDGNEDYNKSIYFTNSDYGILRHDVYSDSVMLSSKVLMRNNIVR